MTMTKTTMKTRITAGILSVITAISVASFATGSASAAEVCEGRTVVIADGVEKEYNDFSEAWTQAVAAKESTVLLNADLNDVGSLTVPAGVKMTVDLKSHAVKAKGVLFKIEKGADCVIKSGCLNHADTAVVADGNIVLKNVNINDSLDSAVKGGKGVKAVIDGCTFRSNKGVQGGAVYLPDYAEGTVIKNSVFENNASEKEGGAVYTGCGLINCAFINNKAGSDGGAIYVPITKEIDLSGCRISGNYAEGCGGGIYLGPLYEKAHRFENVMITDNNAQTAGGVYADVCFAMSANVDFYGEIVIKDNGNNDMFEMKEAGRKAMIYTKEGFNADESYVNVNGADGVAVAELNEETDGIAFVENVGANPSDTVFFNGRLYIVKR